VSTPAAIFDLDRTLLGGASGPVISRMLREVGLISGRELPGEDLLFRLFNVVGENRPSMILTRQAARVAAGWSRATAREAGKLAAEVLIDQVQPYARILIDEHHRAGRVVAIATTTPFDMVEPLADLLGIDDVIATRYGVHGGVYDGTIDGPFVWGRGKLAAVREWAARRQVDLDESYAYSDSYYDAPLLSTVGHPVVVNPDPRMRILAVARRWPTVFLDVPPGVPKFAGLEPQQAVFPFARLGGLLPFVDLHIDGTEHIPREGPAILCGNHRSYFDFMAAAFAIGQAGRPNRFLAKKELFDVPIFGDLFRAIGGIRVDRGTGSSSPLREAAAALEAGEMVTIMPQGTIPRGKAFFDPVLRGRSGAARLSKMTGAPIVPMGLWGTEQVWPRNAKVPNVTTVRNRPEVLVRIGRPFDLDHANMRVDTEQIMSAIVDLLPPEAREWREPTAEELARAMPSGSSSEGDLEHETTRRPGTD